MLGKNNGIALKFTKP